MTPEKEQQLQDALHALIYQIGEVEAALNAAKVQVTKAREAFNNLINFAVEESNEDA